MATPMKIRNKTATDIELGDLCGTTVIGYSDLEMDSTMLSELPFSNDLLNRVNNGEVVLITSTGVELSTVETKELIDGSQGDVPLKVTANASFFGILANGDMSFGKGGAVVRFDTPSYLGEEGHFDLDITSNIGRLTFLKGGSFNILVNMSIYAKDSGFLSSSLDVEGYFQYNGARVTGASWLLERMTKNETRMLTGSISGSVQKNDYIEFVVAEIGGSLNGYVKNSTATIQANKV